MAGFRIGLVARQRLREHVAVRQRLQTVLGGLGTVACGGFAVFGSAGALPGGVGSHPAGPPASRRSAHDDLGTRDRTHLLVAFDS